ncbi:T9SS type A sorting domain-containing protein [Mucilaginibacter sp.]|jgi:hypothetical protein|uniref:T9SS type A sorting domain-containing protein n=1 Tax=Mucilaginibacter sp. TaxID=1882438 RepID=UPI003562D5CF
MKKLLLKPSLEVVFSISLMAILGLPPLVMAQTQKDFEIKIVNGDTTVNGKNIKKLNEQERKDAMAELGNMRGTFEIETNGDAQSNITIKRNNKRNGKTNVIVERRIKKGDQLTPEFFEMNPGDSSSKKFNLKLNRLKKIDTSFAFNYQLDDEHPVKVEMNRDFRFDGSNIRPMRMRFNNRNTQNFNYVNTDNDGISTRISFRVTDAMNNKVKASGGTDKTYLTLNDLNLSPEFSTGKIMLSFNLPAKSPADVKLTDSQGKILFTDKAVAGSFSKKVSLPLNGVYYLNVKQGTASVTKKIVKED